jgi:hypothetical protein
MVNVKICSAKVARSKLKIGVDDELFLMCFRPDGSIEYVRCSDGDNPQKRMSLCCHPEAWPLFYTGRSTANKILDTLKPLRHDSIGVREYSIEPSCVMCDGDEKVWRMNCINWYALMVEKYPTMLCAFWVL